MRFEGPPIPDPLPAPAGFDAALALHGGALDAARRLYPAAPAPWIDLSTGINPHAYPLAPLPEEVWHRLPEAEAAASLERRAARLYRCPPHASVVAAPGTQAIIQRLPALLNGRDARLDVRLLGRTYGEFARVFAAAGAKVRSVASCAALAGADVGIVVNPNNPDGRLLEPAALAALAPTVGALVVDEAFMDALDPRHQFAPALPARQTILLRSFGKFFGLAGLRLGFALATPDLAPDLRAALGPWAVSGPALAVGTQALDDAAWIATMRLQLVEAAARLDRVLAAAGLAPLGGTPLFRLVRTPAAAALFERLAQAGILVRPFADEPDWLRFGLPGTPAAWARLERVVSETV